jgi:hypothetical protein
MRILAQLDSFQPYSSDGITRFLEMENGLFIVGFDLPKEGQLQDEPCWYAREVFFNKTEALSYWRTELLKHISSDGYSLTESDAILLVNEKIAKLEAITLSDNYHNVSQT